MKGAIMQPYFFPYIGYYQLSYDVEKYVFLDDVSFIKQGYINRNSILLGGARHEFSLPVKKASSFRNINEHYYQEDCSKFFKILVAAYKKAPYFDLAMPLIESVIFSSDNVAKRNAESIKAVFDYLDLQRDFIFSSDVRLEEGLKGQDRVLELCRVLEVKKYRNAIGGQDLYSKGSFSEAGIELNFIQSDIVPYNQGRHDFVSHLSIIDVLMHCDKKEIIRKLSEYHLV